MFQTKKLYGPAIDKIVGQPNSSIDEERLISLLTIELSQKDTGTSEEAFNGAIRGFIGHVNGGSPTWKQPMGIEELLERPRRTGLDLFPQVFDENPDRKTISLEPALDGDGSKPNLVLGSWAESLFRKINDTLPRPKRIWGLGDADGSEESCMDRFPELVGWETVADYGPLAVLHLVLTKIANNASDEIRPNGNKFSGFLSKLITDNSHTNLCVKRSPLTWELYEGSTISTRDVDYLNYALHKLPDLFQQIAKQEEAIIKAKERYASLVQSKEAEKNRLIDIFVTKGNAHMSLNLEKEREACSSEIQRYAKELHDTQSRYLSIITTQQNEIARCQESVAKANLLLVDSYNQERINIEKGNNAIREVRNIANQQVHQVVDLADQRISKDRHKAVLLRTCAATTIGFFTLAALCFK